MRTPALLVIAVLALAWQVRGQSPNAACPPRDTVFAITPADTGRGFKFASPAVVRTPPPEFHGVAKAEILITADGNVLADSTRILGASSRQDSSVLARTVRSFQFHPATLRGCNIESWYSMKFSRN